MHESVSKRFPCSHGRGRELDNIELKDRYTPRSQGMMWTQTRQKLPWNTRLSKECQLKKWVFGGVSWGELSYSKAFAGLLRDVVISLFVRGTRLRKEQLDMDPGEKYCGWLRKPCCTTWRPWLKPLVGIYVGHSSFPGLLGSAGFRPSTVGIRSSLLQILTLLLVCIFGKPIGFSFWKKYRSESFLPVPSWNIRPPLDETSHYPYVTAGEIYDSHGNH